MPYCAKCLHAYQGEYCTHCDKGFKDISKGKMAEGGDGEDFTMPPGLVIPKRDTPEYISFLEEKLRDQREKLDGLREENKIISMESQLRDISLDISKEKSTHRDLLGRHIPTGAGHDGGGARSAASLLLHATPSQETKHLTKEEEAALCKFRPLSYLTNSKTPDKATYREFISGMSQVLCYIMSLGYNAKGYAAHMKFIANKAASNAYITEFIIRYEMAVTDKVFSEILPDWVSADPESIAIHLGVEATYAVQGRQRWGAGPGRGRGVFRNTPATDLSSWPKDVCWLYNTRQCNIHGCTRLHVCAKCRSKDHLAKECSDKSTVGAPAEVTRTQSEMFTMSLTMLLQL